MRITYYYSAAYRKTTTVNVSRIWSQLPPEDMTNEEREEIRSGKSVNMCCFDNEDGGFQAVPWSFVIEITDD